MNTEFELKIQSDAQLYCKYGSQTYFRGSVEAELTARENPTPYFTLLEILKLENIFKLKIGSLVHKIQYQKKRNTSCSL